MTTDRLRIVRFGAVGLGATALYALMAVILERPLGFAPVAASLGAYAVAAVFSYCGHKFLTFMSDGPHVEEAPRFAAVTAAGFCFAFLMPLILTDLLTLPSWISVAATCIVVPLFNFIILDRWVFSSRDRPLAPAEN